MKLYKNKKIAILILMILLIAISYTYSYKMSDPYNGTVDSYSDFKDYDEKISKEEAKEDLEYLYETISKKHVSTIDMIPKEFENQYALELDKIDSNIDVLELWELSSRIVKTLEDAHSGIYYFGDDRVIDGSFSFENNILYYEANDKPNELLEVLSIAGVGTKEIFSSFLSQFSYENIYWANNRFPAALSKRSNLKWLGLSLDSNIEMLVIDNNKEEKNISQEFIEKNTNISDTASDYKFVNYKIMEEHDVGVLSLYECNYNETYIKTLEDFFNEVKSNNINNIAIDLRFNGGGNSKVANEFISYLDVDEYKAFGAELRYGNNIKEYNSSIVKNEKKKHTFTGDLYVLTSNGTFSSATMFSTILRDNNLAKIIGEPSGNKPSAFGDVLTFQLPNSGLVLKTTYKKFIRPDIDKNDDQALMPDYEVDYKKVYNELLTITSN